VAGRIRSIEKSSDLIGNRIRDLPAYSIVPQPTMLLCGMEVRLKCSHCDIKMELTVF
jgi:hypothetical protein